MTDPLPVILLASASPRRQHIVAALGVPFASAPTGVDEDAVLRGPGSPREKAVRLARAKAAAARPGDEAFVVGADTIVAFGQEVLGKPASPEEAITMLTALRGNDHQVITGVAVLRRADGAVLADAETTLVRMRRYRDDELQAYVASGDPLDKAGAYAIQHPQFRPVESIAGCYWNVVGLPLCLLSQLLADAGAPVAAAQRGLGDGRCSLCAAIGPFPS
jgi:MAF protein